MMATYVKPPIEFITTFGAPVKKIFLAGSIEMGTAPKWQEMVSQQLKNFNCVVFNPRRDTFDASLKQSIKTPEFKGQVQWELNHLEKADVIAVYLASNTKSPITLMEIGLHAHSGKLVIYCAPDFWRRGNIEVIADRFKIPLYFSYNPWIKKIKEKLK